MLPGIQKIHHFPMYLGPPDLYEAGLNRTTLDFVEYQAGRGTLSIVLVLVQLTGINWI